MKGTELIPKTKKMREKIEEKLLVNEKQLSEVISTVKRMSEKISKFLNFVDRNDLISLTNYLNSTMNEKIKKKLEQKILNLNEISIKNESRLNKILKANSKEIFSCCICHVYKSKNFVFDCGHYCCEDCSSKLQKCPMCRKAIKSRANLFL